MLAKLNQQRDHLPIALVLALSFVLNIVGITWGLPNYVDWAIDSNAPFDVLRAAYFHFSHGWWHFYPPVHLAILAAFCAPIMGYLMLSGGLKDPSAVFPFGLADPLSTLSQVIFVSRVVSALMGVTIVLLVYLTVRELFDRRSALFSALIVALCSPLVYYAHNANVDVPYLFFALLAIYSFLRVLKHGALRDYVLFALFGTLSICTKDQAYGLFLLSPLPIFWMRFTEVSQSSLRRPSLMGVLFDRRHIIAMVVAVVTFVLAQNLLFNLSGFIEHLRFVTMSPGAWNPHHVSTLLGRLQLLWDTISLLAYAFTPPLFVICLIGSFYCGLRFPRYSLPLLFLAASYYLVFINVVSFVQLRHTLPIGIIMAFFGGKLLAEMWSREPWKKLARPAICLAFAYAALFPIQLDVLFMMESRYAAEQWMEENFRKGAIVETFSEHRFHKYYPRFPSWVRVRSGMLSGNTRWDTRTTRPDRVFLPNLFEGGGSPDYIVLSELWYGRFLSPGFRKTDFLKENAPDAEQARVLRDLFQGRTGYTLVAEFKTATIVPIRLPLNPRILIFEKNKMQPTVVSATLPALLPF